MSKKNYPDGITPVNFQIVKNTLQTAVDFGWTKTKTQEELRKSANMTVRQARDLVKAEFDQARRWEEEQTEKQKAEELEAVEKERRWKINEQEEE